MIVMQIFGGLGNQMFQYAAGKALASFYDTELALDVSFFAAHGEYTPRNFGLDVFNINARVATDAEIREHTYGKLKEQFERFTRPWYKRKIVYEPHFHFTADVFKGSGDTYYKGHWQSPKYFAGIESEIRKDFALRYPLSAEGQTVADKIKEFGDSIVSVHIRRGDYVSSKSVQDTIGVLPLLYYESAQRHINSQIKNPHYFIFSDDVEWVEKNMHIENAIYVSRSKNLKDYEEMYLMSMCSNNIVANSSFSWWAAWLNQNPGKIVIAPEKWFNDPAQNTTDLIPCDWITV